MTNKQAQNATDHQYSGRRNNWIGFYPAGNI